MVEPEILELLQRGQVQIEGRLIDASNATLYCSVVGDGVTVAAVYKPVAGERPLWDFPDGTLANREVAAYEVSRQTGWDLIPPTVLRDGPAGPGMLQAWVDTDEAVDPLELIRSEHPDLRRIAVLDAVINNADRKGGHLLPTPAGAIRGIDHGVTFATEDKLRTVLWGWRSQPLTEEAVGVLTRLATAMEGHLGRTLSTLLSMPEVTATMRRLDRLLAEGIHPEPSPDWPAVPWPVF
jgi:uncharacterized repeat protein (TIGR03843 family)